MSDNVDITPVVDIPAKTLGDETLVVYGTELKMLDNGHVAGYLVRFTDEASPDLVGDFFTKETDFGKLATTPVYFNHRMPIFNAEGKSFSIKQEIGEGTLTVDDVGVFIDALLYSRDEYEKQIQKYAGKMGWSSGTAPHLTDFEPKGNARWIKRWPVGLDASITPTPAEPRNTVIPLKSLSANTRDEPKPNSGPEVVEATVQEVEVKAHDTNDPKEDSHMTEQLDIKSIVAEALKEAGPVIAEAAVKAYVDAQPSVTNPGVIEVEIDEGDQPFESPGKYFQAVKLAGQPNSYFDPRLNSLKAPTGLNEGVPSAGGFLLPVQIADGIISNMNSVGSLLAYFKAAPVEGNSMTWNIVAETSRATGSRMGGIRGYWLAEAGTKTASTPAFRQLELRLNKVAALCYATDELLEDASALGSWLSTEVPNELRFLTEYAIYNGDGVGKPEGILGGGALVSATRTDASEIDAFDIARMWSRRYAGVNDYIWLINPGCVPQLLNMSIGNIPVYLPSGNFVGQPQTGQMFGRPVVENEYSVALGTLGDILLVSPSQYKLIEKSSGIQSASSIHVNFTSDESVFRFVYRVDGAPMWYTTLTGFDTVTRSPFVALAATT